MTDFERLRGEYLAHVEEAHEAEIAIAGARNKLTFNEAEMLDIEDALELATKEVDSGEPVKKVVPVIEGANEAKRAAHKRTLLHDDQKWLALDIDSTQLRLNIARSTADLHRAERLYRLADVELRWLIAMAKREEVTA